MIQTVKLWKQGLVLAGIFLIALTFYIFALRINYPFELEWMEGGSLVEVSRIIEGQPIFVPPSIDFVPFIYTPFYFYVSAWLANIIGLSFLPLRLISVGSTVVVYIFTYLFVFQETRNRLSGLLAVGVFAATFRQGGAWFDIARPDMLFLALFLAGCWAMRRRGSISMVGAAALFSIAYYTKQTILIGVLGMFVYLFINRQMLTIAGFAAMIAVLIGGGSFLLNQATHGWYLYYTLEIPSAHRIMLYRESLIRLLQSVLPIWPMLLLSAVYPILCWTQRRRESFWFFGLLLASLLGLAILGTLNLGGYNNALIPLCAVGAIMAVLCLCELSNKATFSSKPAALMLMLTPCMLLSIEFANLYYPVQPQIPSLEDRQAGYQLLNKLAKIDGEVYIPSSSYLNIYLEKKTYAHSVSVQEAEGHFGGKSNRVLENNIDQALASDRFQAVVLDRQVTLKHAIPQVFGNDTSLFEGDRFMPVVGWRNRPETILFRSPSTPSTVGQLPSKP